MDDLSAVRVLVVDDFAPWRQIVVEQLQQMSMQVVGTAADGLDAVQQARALSPDLIAMDLRMPRMSGLAATHEIATVGVESRILIISNESDPSIVQAAFTAGAVGYLLKSRAAVELRKAVWAILHGERYVGSGLRQGDPGHPGRDPHRAGREAGSERLQQRRVHTW